MTDPKLFENMICTLKNTVEIITTDPTLTKSEFNGHERVIQQCIKYFKEYYDENHW